MHSFGKAVGCHGAIILGSKKLKSYLVNFSRPFIYTTSLPEINIAAVKKAYSLFQSSRLRFERPKSFTPIQVVIVPGNKAIKAIAADLQNSSLDVRPILYPTVPKNGERLRIVLHSFNTVDEVNLLLNGLR
jgi:8-amino-7-oxononanoate synthase